MTLVTASSMAREIFCASVTGNWNRVAMCRVSSTTIFNSWVSERMVIEKSGLGGNMDKFFNSGLLVGDEVINLGETHQVEGLVYARRSTSTT